MNLIQYRFFIIVGVLVFIHIGLLIAVIFKMNAARTRCNPPKSSSGFRSLKYEDWRDIDVRKFNYAKWSYSNKYPFVAVIVNVDNGYSSIRFHCGCVIVNGNWILTAGHCIEMFESLATDNIVVRGGSDLWNSELERHILFMTYPDDYNSNSLNADIGLIKVEQAFEKVFEKQIVIAPRNYEYEVNTTVIAVGWGEGLYKDDFAIHNFLYSIELLISSHEYCENLFKKIGDEITKSMFCADSRTDDKYGCHMDSGGPILHNGVVIGISSWGNDCAKVDQPTVYTKLSLFESWVNDVINSK